MGSAGSILSWSVRAHELQPKRGPLITEHMACNSLFRRLVSPAILQQCKEWCEVCCWRTALTDFVQIWALSAMRIYNTTELNPGECRITHCMRTVTGSVDRSACDISIAAAVSLRMYSSKKPLEIREHHSQSLHLTHFLELSSPLHMYSSTF